MRLDTAKGLVVSGGVVTALGIAGIICRQAVFRILSTPYAIPVMRAWEEARMCRYPVLVLFIGLSLVFFGFITAGKIKLPAFRLPRVPLLAALIAGGMLISLREWRHFGSPVWDGYGEFSLRFYQLIFHPGAFALRSFQEFIRGYAHAGSPLGPFLIGLLNAAVGEITLSYMILMFLATLGTAFLLRRMLIRIHRLPAALTYDYLLLFFAHCVVMRSELFPRWTP